MPLPTPVPAQMAPKFSLQGVSFSVTGRTILQPLDLDLAAGKTIGLIGHNGSGKSTLVRLLARQIRPSTGHILFDGRRLETWSNREFARHLAYLPQQTPVPAGTSVRELVKFGRYPWHSPLGAFGRLDEEKVEEALDLTQTTTLAERSVETLSGANSSAPGSPHSSHRIRHASCSTNPFRHSTLRTRSRCSISSRHSPG